MDLPVFLSLQFNGECKLLEVNGESSLVDIKSFICSTWSYLKDGSILCRASVGNIHNCLLSSDVDLRNLLIICHQLYIKLMNVIILNKSNFVHSSEESTNNAQIVEVSNSVPVSCTPSNQGQKPDALLSDNWVNIMEGGVGLFFLGGADDFRFELIKYTTRVGTSFKYVRNDPKYIHVVCVELVNQNCNWFVKAKRQYEPSGFVVYDICANHNCDGSFTTGKRVRLTPWVLGTLVVQHLKNKSSLRGKDVAPLMKSGYGIDLPYWKAYRALDKAREKVFGSYDQSYDQLRWYCEAVTRTNPGGVVRLEVNEESKCFERVFIAWDACIKGFRSCRPMLFVDGTFMKGRAKGILLVATAKDGDNGLFPVAIVVVSSETKANWEWFLKMLRDNALHDREVFYISDRNTGLMAVFQNVFETPIHFYCLYHLQTNLKLKFGKGWTKEQRADLMLHFKESAYAPNKKFFDKKIALFKALGGTTAEEWLSDMPYEKWVVSHYPHQTRYGEMTSNAAESFNSWIKEDREMPITQMLDRIRQKLNGWFVKRRAVSNLWTSALCPSKQQLWNYLSDFGLSWKVIESGTNQYEVISFPSVVVDISLKVCTCWQWQITGFPCSHVVAAMKMYCSAENIFSHIDKAFLSETYKQCYALNIHPIPETEKFDCQAFYVQDQILPQILNLAPGRTKSKKKTFDWRRPEEEGEEEVL